MKLRLLILCLLLPPAALLALYLDGGQHINWWQALTSPHSNDTGSIIIWQIRIPRVLLALVGGASLALAGAGLQAILLNPLADPFLLGVSSAASLGAALAIVMGLSLAPWAQGPWWLALNAFFMACLVALLIYGLARIGRAETHTIILAGLAMNFIFSALTASLQFLAQEGQLRDLMFWMMGTLYNANFTAVGFIGITLTLGLLLMLSQAWNLNALAAGDEAAAALGVSAQKVNLLVMLVSCLLTAVVVSFMGAVGFVGLLAPHLARAMVDNDHRYLLPAAAVCGALLLLMADTLSRMVLWPMDLPVGIMTALLGGPFFIVLLVRGKNNW